MWANVRVMENPTGFSGVELTPKDIGLVSEFESAEVKICGRSPKCSLFLGFAVPPRHAPLPFVHQ
jgi:hypothetical protein